MLSRTPIVSPSIIHCASATLSLLLGMRHAVMLCALLAIISNVERRQEVWMTLRSLILQQGYGTSYYDALTASKAFSKKPGANTLCQIYVMCLHIIYCYPSTEATQRAHGVY